MNNPEHCRDITKLFLLLSLNASDEQALYKAFRSELNYREYPYSFPDDMLSELLDTIKEHHLGISHMICIGAGLRLMDIDGRICDYVISDFVKTDTPILTVHDSFIVQSRIETGFWICSNHFSKAISRMDIKEDWKDIGNILCNDY